jgi:transcriptional regulator with XRE-family HTH domain
VKHEDLRLILSENIRLARKALHITQEKLAIYADISLPYMTDIERCKTWVSDKTLKNIAAALNVQAYELLIPPKTGLDALDADSEAVLLRQIADLTGQKKHFLEKTASDAMDDLVMQILRLYSRRGPADDGLSEDKKE